MKLACYSYIQLTKPRVMLLVLLTGATALILQGNLIGHPVAFGLVILGLYLTGGSANALNQYFERELDARMSRTRNRRPLPLGRLTPFQALGFGIGIGIVGILLFGFVFNWLSALLAAATILFYGLFYTLWLKPQTAQNIVIGGIAGAMAPVIAWAAASGSLTVVPWALFLIVFAWTPPHFWALALYFQDDYRKTGLPMLPVVKGERVTVNQSLYYSLILVAVSLALMAYGAGLLYLVVAVALGGYFIWRVLLVRRACTRATQRALFAYSIVYLLALFVAMAVDHLLI